VALQVAGVRQHQVGEGHGLGGEGVAHHQEGDLVVALPVLVGQHLAHPTVFMLEFQAMLAMKRKRVSRG
jgi:hypothetical protein